MKKGFFGRKTPKRMATKPKRMATKPKMMAKKKSLLLTKEDLHQDKLLIKSIIIKEKQIPVKAMKLSSGPKSKEVSLNIKKNK